MKILLMFPWLLLGTWFFFESLTTMRTMLRRGPVQDPAEWHLAAALQTIAAVACFALALAIWRG